MFSDGHLDRSRWVLQMNAKFNAMFTRVGDYWEIPDDMFSEAKELPLVLYGKPRFKIVNELRFQLLKQNVAMKIKLQKIQMLISPTCHQAVIL